MSREVVKPVGRHIFVLFFSSEVLFPEKVPPLKLNQRSLMRWQRLHDSEYQLTRKRISSSGTLESPEKKKAHVTCKSSPSFSMNVKLQLFLREEVMQDCKCSFLYMQYYGEKQHKKSIQVHKEYRFTVTRSTSVLTCQTNNRFTVTRSTAASLN